MLLHIFEFWSDAHLLVLQWCSFIFTVGPFTQCLISWLCTQTWIKLLVSFCELKEKSIKVNHWLLLNKPLYSMLKLNCRSAESMIDCGVQLCSDHYFKTMSVLHQAIWKVLFMLSSRNAAHFSLKQHFNHGFRRNHQY